MPKSQQKKIKNILGKYEVIRRDMNGEMLEGCNVYIDYIRTVYPETPAKMVDVIKKVLEMSDADLSFENYSFTKGQLNDLKVWKGDNYLFAICCYDFTAEKLADAIYKGIIDRQ